MMAEETSVIMPPPIVVCTKSVLIFGYASSILSLDVHPMVADVLMTQLFQRDQMTTRTIMHRTRLSFSWRHY